MDRRRPNFASHTSCQHVACKISGINTSYDFRFRRRFLITRYPLSAQLLQVSRQIYREASVILYGENVFGMNTNELCEASLVGDHQLAQPWWLLIRNYAIIGVFSSPDDFELARCWIDTTCDFLADMPKGLSLDIHLKIHPNFRFYGVLAPFAKLRALMEYILFSDRYTTTEVERAYTAVQNGDCEKFKGIARGITRRLDAHMAPTYAGIFEDDEDWRNSGQDVSWYDAQNSILKTSLMILIDKLRQTLPMARNFIA